MAARSPPALAARPSVRGRRSSPAAFASTSPARRPPCRNSSPSCTHLLVTGRALRLHDADGAVVRTFHPPPGMEVVEAAWSPDWSGFVYIARTIGVSQYE